MIFSRGRGGAAFGAIAVTCGMMGLCLISGAVAEAETPQPGEAVNGLKATLRVQGSTFREGEYIPLELELQNVSDKPFSIYRDLGPTPTPAGVTFLLRHGEGPVIRELASGNKTVFGHIRLEPGDSKKYSLVMTIRHPNKPGLYLSDLKAPELEIARMLKPGDWELWIQVNYQKGAGKAAGISDAWEGAIVSSPVRFKVMEARPSAVLSGIPRAGEPVNGLKAVLKIPGNIFHLGKRVPLDLELQNVSSAPFSIYQRLRTAPIRPGYVRGFVRPANGTFKELSLSVSRKQKFSSVGEHIVRLKAGTLRLYPFVLGLSYTTDQSKEDADFERALPVMLTFKPGEYELLLELIFEGDKSKTSDIWEGVVVSNPVSFKVTE